MYGGTNGKYEGRIAGTILLISVFGTLSTDDAELISDDEDTLSAEDSLFTDCTTSSKNTSLSSLSSDSADGIEVPLFKPIYLKENLISLICYQ